MASTMERSRPGKSEVWTFFSKKDNCLATCNTCGKDYSYKTSVSNLRKHWYHVHGRAAGDLTDASTDMYSSDGEELNGSEIESKNSSANKPLQSTWKYFNVKDSDKFEATCKICFEDIAYDTVADLTEHVRAHGVTTKESDEDEEPPEVQMKKSSARRFSKVWTYFKITNEDAKLARCALCSKEFNYSSSVSNLRRHLTRIHKQVSLDDNNKNKDPIGMTEIYLEDEDELLEQLASQEIRPPSPPQKTPPKLTTKHNVQTRFVREKVRNRNRDSSSEDEQPNKRRKITKNVDSLDLFGQYVTSLLKKLPDSASDQLQSEIIKLILTTKTSLELQATKKYAITISENHLHHLDHVDTEPVTVTISEAQDNIEHVIDNSVVEENTDIKDTIRMNKL